MTKKYTVELSVEATWRSVQTIEVTRKQAEQIKEGESHLNNWPIGALDQINSQVVELVDWEVTDWGDLDD